MQRFIVGRVPRRVLWIGAAALLLGVLSAYWWGLQPRAAGFAAELRGGPLAPEIRGTVTIRPARGGSWVTVRVEGLPGYSPGPPPTGPLGFHMHENGTCEVGDPNQPFLAAGGHFNPDGQPHGNHAGDFPVLFSNDGVAEEAFFTDRFRPREVVGRSVIIHQNPDDYRTQPAGDSGPRLACGVIG